MNKNKWFLNGGRGSGKTFRLLWETYENKIANLEKEKAELKAQIKKMKMCAEWQTGIPIKKWEIFARTTANCNLLATYFDGAWRNVWNGGIIDFDKITMWRYTGFKNNGEEIDFKELAE